MLYVVCVFIYEYNLALFTRISHIFLPICNMHTYYIWNGRTHIVFNWALIMQSKASSYRAVVVELLSFQLYYMFAVVVVNICNSAYLS